MPSWLTVAANLPSGLKATSVIQLACPSSRARSRMASSGCQRARLVRISPSSRSRYAGIHWGLSLASNESPSSSRTPACAPTPVRPARLRLVRSACFEEASLTQDCFEFFGQVQAVGQQHQPVGHVAAFAQVDAAFQEAADGLELGPIAFAFGQYPLHVGPFVGQPFRLGQLLGLLQGQGDRDKADHDGQDRAGAQGGQGRLAAGPFPGPLHPGGRPGPDRLAVQIALQLLGQVGGAAIAPARLLFQALQADGFQIAGNPRLQPMGAIGSCRRASKMVSRAVAPWNGGRPVSSS